MTVKVELLISLETVTCAHCGIVFGIESGHRSNLVESGATFYCPSGHPQSYGEGTIVKLKKQLSEEESDKNWWKNRAESNAREADSIRKKLSTTKGILTKTQKRIAAGVCPCCHRQFINLQRHIEGQHPNYPKNSGGIEDK